MESVRLRSEPRVYSGERGSETPFPCGHTNRPSDLSGLDVSLRPGAPPPVSPGIGRDVFTNPHRGFPYSASQQNIPKEDGAGRNAGHSLTDSSSGVASMICPALALCVSERGRALEYTNRHSGALSINFHNESGNFTTCLYFVPKLGTQDGTSYPKPPRSS